MSSPFVAEIRIFAGNFAPTGWAECNGQLLPISQNTALFSLLGTFYGGDGKSTFALPNLQDAAPMHQGDGIGLSQRFLGEQGGSPFVTLLTTEMPFHNHFATGADVNANVNNASQSFWAGNDTARQYTGSGPTANKLMAAATMGITGGSLPHNNQQPYLVLTFIIAMQGVFPPRQ